MKCKGLLVIAQKAKQAKSGLYHPLYIKTLFISHKCTYFTYYVFLLDYQAELDKHKTQVLNFEKEKDGLLNNIKTLQELVDSLTEQKLNYITEIDAAQSKIRNYEDKINSHQDEIKKLKADLIIRDKKLATALQHISDVDSELTSFKRQNNRLLDENEQLINQLTEMEAKVAEFNNIGLQQREQLQLLEKTVEDGKCS